MKRKAVFVVLGIALLVAAYLGIRSAARPRYFAQGRIVLGLQLVAPTNDPAMSNWNWYVSQKAVSNWNYDWIAAVSEWNRFVDQPANTRWYGHVRDPSTISNVLAARLANVVRDSMALSNDIQLFEICPYRGSSLVGIRFSGNEPNAVWRVTSNACVMLTQFYLTNLPVELQTTNFVDRENVEYVDTGFWAPPTLWENTRDSVDSFFRRVF